MRNRLLIILLLISLQVDILGVFAQSALVYPLKSLGGGSSVSVSGTNVRFSSNSEGDTSVYVGDFLLFRNGDSANWANYSYNDKHWIPIDSTAESLFEKNSFSGIGWYRLHIRPDPDLLNRPIALRLKHLGASEIYLDGKLLSRQGKVSSKAESEKVYNPTVSPIPLVFTGDSVHIIAIRYSNTKYIYNQEHFNEYEAGLDLAFVDIEKYVKNNSNIQRFVVSIFTGLFGVLTSLALVHLFIFLYNREKRFNLYHSFFVGSLGLLFLVPVAEILVDDVALSIRIAYYSPLIAPFFFVSITGLLHNFFYGKFNRFFYINVIIAILNVVLYLLGYSNVSNFLIISQTFMIYFGTNITAIKALKKKLEGARMISGGVLLFTLLIIFDGFFLWSVKKFHYIDNDTLIVSVMIGLIILAVLSLPLSMSIYLAFDFARTNRRLQEELKHVEELNKKSVAQEREKQQILANQNIMLEMQVRERTEEILTQKEEIEAQRDELENINRLIDHKNQEITDSITYARRIQRAILPDLEEIQKLMPQSFVLFKPKDIVSGDFYFYKQVSETSCIIAAADCTGHGVPGAFMSLLATDVLNDAVKIYKEPSSILSHANKGIKSKLKQYGDGATRDGLDIALLYIDTGTKEIIYSAANRPLWIIKHNELQEFKPTKSALGGFTSDDQSFESYRLTMTSGEIVYLFSDGYADQFGGDKGKKMMTKKFRETLVQIQHFSMPDQMLQLDLFYNTWKGEYEQVDDVLVIGIKF